MPKRISILPHHELEELETRYRQSKESVERNQYQIVWLLRSGKTTSEVSEVTGYSLRWIYSFVHPESGETYWWVLPRVNTDLFNQVLADFAQEFGLGDYPRSTAGGNRKHVLLAVDRAGWHMSKELQISHGLHFEFLPPYSPELQPAERLWTLTNEPIANNYFESIEELEDALVARCQVLLEHKAFISRLTYYHWWPKSAI